jgi:5-methylcytosine-specific restriction enzyme subunit McrC
MPKGLYANAPTSCIKMPIIPLTEYKSLLVPREQIPKLVVDELKEKYSSQIDINLQYSQTGDLWTLTSKGWVGYIPLTPEFQIALYPKVPLSNLFGMLEYAYNLKSFYFLSGLINCQSLEDFYSEFALILAQRTLDRVRQGIYRAYLPKTNQLSYVRGRLNVRQAIEKPWNIKLSCVFEEYTSDLEDNQILFWTLRCITRSGICQERVLLTVRRAYHTLQGLLTLQPFKSEDCVGREYNRLNEDYRSLHAICRFFLENTAPFHQLGNRTVLPFLVDMEHLYELFVAEWLKAHLPTKFYLKYQEVINIGKKLQFKMDLVLYESKNLTPLFVLDTKYKVPNFSAPSDISQVVTYAVSKNCFQAILVYPINLKQQLDEWIGAIRVRSLTFTINGDLNQAGFAFLRELFEGKLSGI